MAGETTRTLGSSACSNCDLGEFGGVETDKPIPRHGFCFDCPAGYYNDAKSSLFCLPCPVDTFGVKIRATAAGDCQACQKWHAPFTTTSGRTAVSNATSGCVCYGERPNAADMVARLGFYTTVDIAAELAKPLPAERKLCLRCPSGADCEFDGMHLDEISALNGYWRPHPWSSAFTACQQAFPGLFADQMASEVCCPNVGTTASGNNSSNSNNSNNSNSNSNSNVTQPALLTISSCKHFPDENGTFRQNVRFSHPNEQCKEGYGGPLCGSCAARYVRKPDLTCEYCETGPSLSLSLALMSGTATFFSIFLVFMLRCCSGKAEQMDSTKDKVSGLIGQFKIFLTFVQLLGSVPAVLVSVPWPTLFLEFTNPLKFVNFQFLSVFSGSICGATLPFLDQFVVDMSFPGMLALAIAFAYFVTRTENTELQKRRRAMTSKALIIVVLFLFPGLTTSILTVFRCSTIQGMDGAMLTADLSEPCYEGRHATMLIVAFVFTGLYIFGVPLAILAALYGNRRALHNESHPEHDRVVFELGSLYMQCEFIALSFVFDFSFVCQLFINTSEPVYD